MGKVVHLPFTLLCLFFAHYISQDWRWYLCFWALMLEPCSGLCSFAYVIKVIQWRGGEEEEQKQNQWGILNCSSQLKCFIHLKLPYHPSSPFTCGVLIYTETHTCAYTHAVLVQHTLKPTLRDLCVWLLSRLTTSSQVRNLVNNSLYLPSPLFKTYNVCIAVNKYINEALGEHVNA